MELNILTPRKSINKAFLKVKPNRTQIETFKKNIIHLFEQINESESEEFHKNIISEFLKGTYYSPNHYINTKGRADLVIHTGKDTTTPVGVLFETKKPGNRSEMPTINNLNSKAFNELILYYLRERIINKNIDIKYLVITNIYEWFIFSANDFERLFANDKTLLKQFSDFEDGRLAGNTTDFFYNSVAGPSVSKIESQIFLTHFDIRDFESVIKNADIKDDNKLIALYKIFSPEHLLKLSFANDSNSLDKTFYSELLHIIGLKETKEGSKKIIGREKEENRNQGSIIENAITILKSEDCLSQIPKRSDFGSTPDEQLFNMALELSITWINRILFLKLLEGQLVKYNIGDKAFRFLNIEKVHDLDELNKLFFQVLAVKETERIGSVKQKYANIPYLNSSLFEPSELEHKTIRISNLDDHAKLPLLSNTILKDNTGRKRTGDIEPLEYLFAFLEAYDFSSEGSEDIQEENKTLINASVLGLIFEKINGYKDGSFFTPGFITMYMSHETIRRVVVQKFNDVKGWQCETISDVYNKIENIKEANQIVNSLRICDPAVGSGHFLVSALNEIIAIKSELKILSDKEGKKLKEYTIEVINDELIITDEQSILFEYNPKSKESQRVQEALFQEKQKIIENCLFGVDINPNSVKICRLRLWIELLKNAYYKHGSGNRELETLPNIDINIKCGNSLISRYSLDVDIKTALKSSKWTVDNYREAVMTYRNAQSKDEKRSMEQLISKIKSDFETEVSKSDKRFLKLNKLKGELLSLTGQSSLFELTKTQKDDWNKKVKTLTEEIKKYETEIAEIKNNKIYENAFEWRFEFPEVLNNDGDFVGFDVVIGNPPYGVDFNSNEKRHLSSEYLTREDVYTFFMEKGLKISNSSGFVNYILPIFWLTGDKYLLTRKLISNHAHLEIGITLPYNIFLDAYVDTGIFLFSKREISIGSFVYEFEPKDIINYNILLSLKLNKLIKNDWCNNEDLKIVLNPVSRSLSQKFNKLKIKVSDVTDSIRGILANEEDYSISKINDDYEPIFVGKLDRYLHDDTFKYIKYGSNLKEKPSSFDYFKGERLLVRRIINRQFRIMATITSESFVTKKDIYTIQLNTNSISCKYLLAILNSKLISFINTSGSTSAKKDDFTQLTLNDLRQIRIPSPNPQQKEMIENCVNQILLAKKSDPNFNTDNLEAEIDCLVYELYGLTEDEIRIIEN